MWDKLSKLNIFSEKEKKQVFVDSLQRAKKPFDRRQVVESIQKKLQERRSWAERLADNIVGWLGSVWFVGVNILVFSVWIILNSNIIPGFEPFDPFPYILLTLAVSLEAIFLAIFILMIQGRETKTSNLREEIDLQINMVAEREITKIIHLLAHTMKHLGVSYEHDPELKRMMEPLNTEDIRKELEQQLDLTPRNSLNGKKESR